MTEVLEQAGPTSADAAFTERILGAKSIRVLHIITRMIVGGAQENTLLSVEGLDRMPEYDVVLLSGIDRGREGELLSRARQTTKLVVVPELGRAVNPFEDLKAFWKVYKHIREG